MPIEKAKITFFNISQCGYYNHRTTQHRFGNLKNLLEDVTQWGDGKELSATKVFEPEEGGDVLPTYLLQITAHNDTWLMTMWNETPSIDGQLAVALGSSNVGNAKIVMQETPEGGIPGFSTYFWFIPELNVVASIRFQHLLAGQQGMRLYLDSFLSSCTRHVVCADDEQSMEIEIIGYRENENAETEDLHPRFKTELFKKAGPHELLLQNADRIRKIVRKTTLNLRQKIERDFWQQLAAMIRNVQHDNSPEKLKIKYEIPSGELNQENVQQIITAWDEEHDREWDDYGFKLKGEANKIHWLSHAFARQEFDLDVRRDNLEVINARSLIEELCRKRADIVRLLDEQI